MNIKRKSEKYEKRSYMKKIMINKKDLEINLCFFISIICLLPIYLLLADFLAFSIEMTNRLLSKDFKSKFVNYVIMGI